jgi:hypothetical protein
MVNSDTLIIFILILLIIIISSTIVIYAESNQSIIPISSSLGLQKNTITMDIPSDNKLPWGSIKGIEPDAVPGYPVIIKMYKDDVMVNIAQTEMNEDGSYEYILRIRNLDVNTGVTINIYEGEYTVEIFKVVDITNHHPGVI